MSDQYLRIGPLVVQIVNRTEKGLIIDCDEQRSEVGV